MKVKKIIYLSLFVLMWVIIVGISFENSALARSGTQRRYRTTRRSNVGKGLFFGGLGGATIGGIAGGRNGALIGFGAGASVGAIAGAASDNRRVYEDYDSDDCGEFCDEQ